jgi:hypothetical protein
MGFSDKLLESPVRAGCISLVAIEPLVYALRPLGP